MARKAEFDPKRVGFDAQNSRAILIGQTSFPRYRGLRKLPAVANNVHALAARLANEQLVGFGEIITILDQSYHAVIEMLYDACRDLIDRPTLGPDCLLIYYAGHGIRSEDDNDRLLLSARNTSDWYADDTAIPVSSLKRILSRCTVSTKIVILDCCYSGKSLRKDLIFPNQLAEQAGKAGTFTICSSGPRERSFIPRGGRYTGFTKALLAVLDEGIDPKWPTITLGSLYSEVRNRCIKDELPPPLVASVGTVEEFAFAKNGRFENELTNQDLIKTIQRAPISDDVRGKLVRTMEESRDREKQQSRFEPLDRMLYQQFERRPDKGILAMARRLFSEPGFRSFYDTSKRPTTTILKQEANKLTIGDRGDTHCHWLRRFTTAEPTHWFWGFIGGDEPVADFEHLELTSTIKYNKDGRFHNVRTVILPLLDSPKRKEFLLYFYPTIPAKSLVHSIIDYQWPGMFAPLIEKRADVWSFTAASAAEIVPEISMTFDIYRREGDLTIINQENYQGDLISVAAGPKRCRYKWIMRQIRRDSNITLQLSLPPRRKTADANQENSRKCR